jgi:hypothetical protein
MNERVARIAVAAAFFIYVLFIRVYDIADTFLMLGEQTRDWTIALGGITELPLTGAPSTAGGTGFGPAYYWILWIGRVIVGPFADDLPHAGGFWVALLQSIGDTWLLVVLWTRVGPFLALAMCLTIASAPFDVAISSVIWNPPVAAALIKMATAMALSLGHTPPPWKIGATALLGWLAVQVHVSAVFVAAPLIGAIVVQPLFDTVRPLNWRASARLAGLVAAIIVIAQIPFFITAIRNPAAPMGPASAISNIANATTFRIDRGYVAVVNITGELLARRIEEWPFQIPTAIAGLIAVLRWRRDVVALAVSVGGLLTASVLFAAWSRNYDSYWFLCMTPAMALTYGLAIAAVPSRAAVHGLSGVLAAAMVMLQPERIEQSTAFFKYPPYRIMRMASYDLAAREPMLRDIRVNFEGAHPTMDKYFIYRILGGRIDPAAPRRAFVNADGSVSIEEAERR